MMRLFIEGRQVDLMQDEPLLITREIADVREPEKRSSDWSKTFRIPGTSDNNKLFGHIFDINQEQLNSGSQFGPDFNPNKKAAAWVTVNEAEIVRGFIRMLNISVIRRGEIQYEISFHGVSADFFAKIRNKRMSELDLSSMNHLLNKTNVKNSWSNTVASGGYVYAMIDRGRADKPYDAWGCTDLTPCIFAKRIVDEIFSEAGYTYTADSFFNTDEFKSRVVPFPKPAEISEATLTGMALRARRSSDQTFTTGGTLIFNDDSSSGYYDNGGNYSTTTGKYTLPYTGVEMSARLSLNLNITGAGLGAATYVAAKFSVRCGGKERATFFLQGQNISGVNISEDVFVYIGSGAAGTDIEVQLVALFDASAGLVSRITGPFQLKLQTDSTIEIEGLQSVTGVNMLVDFNSAFSKSELTQEKFISDIIKLDNLYIEPTEYLGQLYIAPRDTFYRNTVTHDLTALIDRDQPLEIIPMGELEGNPYVFTMAQGKDTDSDEYQKATGKIYGESRIIIDNEFVQQEKKVDTAIASTPYIYAGGKFVIASMGSADKSNGDVRMLYWSGKITATTWRLCDWVTDQRTYINDEVITGGYPHAGHLDNPFTPTKDLNFGMPAFVNLPAGITYTNNNLYNRNWRKYINEITDRNSKLVKARVYITPGSFIRWQFRDLYFFDGQYFRLNKISDYPVGSAEVVQCEFLKIKEAAAFTPSTGKTGGGYDTKDDNNDRWPDLRNGFDKPQREYATGGTAGDNTLNNPTMSGVIKAIDDRTHIDIGTPTTGDKYRPALEWTGAEWDITLIKEV